MRHPRRRRGPHGAYKAEKGAAEPDLSAPEGSPQGSQTASVKGGAESPREEDCTAQSCPQDTQPHAQKEVANDDEGNDSLKINALFSPLKFLRRVLPRGERAQTQIPALVPTAGDKNEQMKVFVLTVFDAQFPQQHFVQLSPASISPLSRAAALTDGRLPVDKGILPNRLAHVQDDRERAALLRSRGGNTTIPNESH